MDDERYLCIGKKSILAHGQAERQRRCFCRGPRATLVELMIYRVVCMVGPTWGNVPSCTVGQPRMVRREGSRSYSRRDRTLGRYVFEPEARKPRHVVSYSGMAGAMSQATRPAQGRRAILDALGGSEHGTKFRQTSVSQEPRPRYTCTEQRSARCHTNWHRVNEPAVGKGKIDTGTKVRNARLCEHWYASSAASSWGTRADGVWLRSRGH